MDKYGIPPEKDAKTATAPQGIKEASEHIKELFKPVKVVEPVKVKP